MFMNSPLPRESSREASRESSHQPSRESPRESWRERADERESGTEGAPLRDLSTLGWVAPSLRTTLEDAAAELARHVEEVLQAPEALGAQDTTSLRLAGQHLHQAAGAVHIVGLRGIDAYCGALRQLLDAIDAGTVPANAAALTAFRVGVQALAEYVDDLMAGDEEDPLRLFQPYAALLTLCGAERVHPADLWAEELRILPGILLPTLAAAAVMRARQRFEIALLKALRLPSGCRDIAMLQEAWLPLQLAMEEVRTSEQPARRANDHADRGLWHVLALVFRALAHGLLPSDMLSKRFAGRVHLLLRQYLQGQVRVPQAMLVDAIYLLVSTKLVPDEADTPAARALRADIVQCLQAFALDAEHAALRADPERRYYGWLDANTVRHIQLAAAALEPAAQQDSAVWQYALGMLADAARPLAQPALQRCLAASREGSATRHASGIALFLSRALALPWRVHGDTAHPAATAFSQRCEELAAALAGPGRGDFLPVWLAQMVAEAQAQAERADAVKQLRAQLDAGESWLDTYDRGASLPDAADVLDDARRAFESLRGILTGLYQDDGLAEPLADQAGDVIHTVDAVMRQLGDLRAGAVDDHAGALAAIAADLGQVRAFADILEFGRVTPQDSTESGGAAVRTDAPGPLASARQAAQEVIRIGARADDPALQQLRAALAALDQQAGIDDNVALRRQAADAITQLNAWLAGSESAADRLVLALADQPAPAPAPPLSPAPVPVSVAIDSASIDAELLDIFLTEADEVLGNIAADIAGGLDALRSADMLSRVRRAFHTLKGSGRMVGLNRFGEAAWAIEQVMNLWIAETREPVPGLVTLLQRAHAEMLSWVAALRADSAATHDIDALLAQAEYLRDPARGAAEAETVMAASEPVDQPAAAAASLSVEAGPQLVAEPAVEPAVESTDDAGNIVAFQLPGTLSGEDDNYKTVGPIRIGLQLYNVYLQEADDLLRKLGTDISEWRHESYPAPSELALRVAHTLQGSASTVGLEPVREIAEALERLLLVLGSHPVAMHPGDFRLLDQAVDRLRGMLHQFAAGMWPDADAGICRALQEFGERALVRPRVQLPEAETEAEEQEASEADSMASLLAQPARNEDGPIEEDPPAEPVQAAAPTPAPVEPVMAQPAPEVTAGPAHQDAVVLSLPRPRHMPLAAAAHTDAQAAELDQALVDIFLEEAHGSLPELGRLLRTWEATPQEGQGGALLLRSLHTLKGSARMAGAMALGQAAHEMETLLDASLRGQRVNPQLFERLYAWYDRILAHTEALQAGRLLPVDDADVVNGYAEAEPEILDEQPAVAADGAVGADGTDGTDGTTSARSLMLPATPAQVVTALAPAQPEPGERQRAMVRVQARALDGLINDVGEVGAVRVRLDSELESLRAYLGELNDNVGRLRGQLREIEIQAESQMASRIADAQHNQEFDPLEFDRFTRFQELTRMMAESVNDVATVEQNLHRGFDRAATDLAAQARITRGLQRGLMQARMVQFDALAERLYRVARQAAAETGKEVRLLIKGGTVEVDRSVLDRMAGPIEHLIRNAVVHGIEPADVRRAAGKPAAGTLTLEVQQEGNEVVLHFVDDGGGLDLPRIRARAVERRLLAADEEPSDARLTEMIFTPGFSTAESVSELAGRGVGMDVVRAETVGLGGRIALATETGRGTTFTVHLPLTTAITQVLVVSVAGRLFAIPSGMIDQVQQLRTQALLDAYNAGRLPTPQGEVAFHYFGLLLDQGQAQAAGRKYSPVVVAHSGADRVAVHVDDVVGNREVVVKHIGPHLARLEGIAGATTLGDGEIVLIYNPVVLAQRFARDRVRPVPAVGDAASAVQATLGAVAEMGGDGSTAPVPGLYTPPSVMVVDDSLTVRKATQRLLSRAGYEVLLARDGVDALKQLQDVMPDAMLVDIEMPNMDGFDLTRNIRSDTRTTHMPLVMITSRTADKHRRYAEEIGVDVYLGKPYNEDHLLETLQRLIGERAAGTAGSVAQMLGDDSGR